MKTFKKVISLGKIDYNGTGRKINTVEIEVEIKEKNIRNNTVDLQPIDTYNVLSMSAHVWDSKKTDYISCGQILDELVEYFPKNEFLIRLVEIWKVWHSNDLNEGTTVQINFIETLKKSGWEYNYIDACNKLQMAGIYRIDGYKYGHSWLVNPLPVEIIEEIKYLVDMLSK